MCGCPSARQPPCPELDNFLPNTAVSENGILAGQTDKARPSEWHWVGCSQHCPSRPVWPTAGLVPSALALWYLAHPLKTHLCPWGSSLELQNTAPGMQLTSRPFDFLTFQTLSKVFPTPGEWDKMAPTHGPLTVRWRLTPSSEMLPFLIFLASGCRPVYNRHNVRVTWVKSVEPGSLSNHLPKAQRSKVS